MAAFLSKHVAMFVVQTISGNSPQILGYSEKASQTFKNGGPVQLASGYLQEWDGTTVAAGILGICPNAGSNLANNGLGAPGAFGSVGAPGAALYQQNVQNQTSAYNIPHGSPMVDGRNLAQIANHDTIFYGQIDNNTGSNYTLLAADIGASFGMTKDTSGYWYIDRAKTGGSAVVTILKADPNQGLIANACVYFQFLASAMQFLA